VRQANRRIIYNAATSGPCPNIGYELAYFPKKRQHKKKQHQKLTAVIG
jgi:hypothetical protein